MKKLIFVLVIIFSIEISLFAEYIRDHTKEIVTDESSGLMWQDSRLKHAGWKDSIDYCENLELAEFNDWRLPNFNELYYLSDRNKSQPAISDIFRNTRGGRNYWTSTVHYNYENRNPIVWRVHFGPGTASWEHEINDYSIRCVRNISKIIDKKEVDFSNLKTGQTKNIYKNDDGKLQNGITRHFIRDNNIIIDNITKLEWQDSEINITLKKKWSEAKEYCAKMKFSGYEDWRLPEIDELVSITYKGKYRNSIYSEFKKSKSANYWTSSTYLQNKETAWVVDFNGGASFSQSKEHDFNFRCVREGNKISKIFTPKPLLNKMKTLDNKNNEQLDIRLYNAIKKDDIILAKTLIKKGAYINTVDSTFRLSTLHVAVENKNFEMVRLLVEQGANINYNGYSDITALMIAASDNNIKIMEYLLDHQADINKTGMNGSALFFALNITTPSKYTNILANRKTANYLISKGINLNLLNEDDESALMYSIRFKNIESFKYLVKKGADINKRNKEGKNVLFYLIQNYPFQCEKCNDTSELMQYIIDNKIDINSPDKYNNTPLHISVLYGKDKLTRILVKNRASLNIKDSQGQTPLYFAIDNDDFITTKYLVENGASLDVEDYNQITPYGNAIRKNNSQIIKFLQKKMKEKK